MRVAILNWRDPESPRRGGAELVTHEVARRLAERGYELIWLSSRFPEAARETTLDGVRIVRRGSELTTRQWAPAFVRKVQPDVVLEEVNTLPYLAPLWTRQPVLLLMHQLARDVWWYEAPKPVAALGWLAEPLYLRAFRHTHAITVSESSRSDLRTFGLRGPIAVAPLAVSVPRLTHLAPKEPSGRLVAIGRLTPSKRFDHAIEALARLRQTVPTASLTLVGDGRERARLERQIHDLALTGSVRVLGHVPEHAKLAAIDDADIVLGTSVREGWGLTVTEAAVRGIPAVVYLIPGFRDAVQDGVTGLTVESSPDALADAVASLVNNPARYELLRKAAWRATAGLSFDRTADAFEDALDLAVRSARARSG